MFHDMNMCIYYHAFPLGKEDYAALLRGKNKSSPGYSVVRLGAHSHDISINFGYFLRCNASVTRFIGT